MNADKCEGEYSCTSQGLTLVSEKPLQDHKREVNGNVFVAWQRSMKYEHDDRHVSLTPDHLPILDKAIESTQVV